MPVMGQETNHHETSTTLQSHAQAQVNQRDVDEALKLLRTASVEQLEVDSATNKRLLRRIDLFLMPIMCTVYLLNFLDKTTLSYASVMGLREDIGIDGAQYSWLGSLFYIGYIVWEWPTSRLLQYLPLAKYSAFCVISWGIVLACFAAVTNFAGAVAIRFFLGMLEASVTPGFTLFTSQWYTIEEQGFRTSLWFSFNGFAQVIGGLIAYGIARGDDAHAYTIMAWKIVFLLTGSLTILVGIAFLFIMPDNQSNAWWLSSKDRLLAVQRVQGNQQGIGNKVYKLYQLKEAVMDPMTWAFFVYTLLADIPNGGVTNFFSLLIESFGYTSEQSLLYGTPAGAVEVICLLGWGWLSGKYGHRLLFAAAWNSLSLAGFVMILAIPEQYPIGRLFGYYLYNCIPAGFVAVLSLISSNVAGYTKKTTVAALVLIAYCIGNLIGPQTFRSNNYVPAEITIIVCIALAIVILVLMHFYYVRQNRYKARLRGRPINNHNPQQAWLDLTDRENVNFVYAY